MEFSFRDFSSEEFENLVNGIYFFPSNPVTVLAGWPPQIQVLYMNPTDPGFSGRVQARLVESYFYLMADFAMAVNGRGGHGKVMLFSTH